MTSLQTIKSANELLQQDVTFVQAWLQGVQNAQIETPEAFNWHGLAAVAAADAHRALDRGNEARALRWAEISISIYEQLANQRHDNSFLESAIALRAAMIKALGVIADHPILNVQLILDWALSDLNMSPEEARERAKRLQDHWGDRDYFSTHLDEVRQMKSDN